MNTRGKKLFVLLQMLTLFFMFGACQAHISSGRNTPNPITPMTPSLVTEATPSTQVEELTPAAEAIDLEQKYNYSALFFLNSKVGWVASNEGLLRTTDGGDSWKVTAILAWDIKKLFFADTDNGWAVTANLISGSNSDMAECHVMQTTDGGKTWTQQLEARVQRYLDSNMINLCMLNTSNGFVLFSDAGLYQTKDGGTTWSEVMLFDKGITLAQMNFVDTTTGWVCGDINGSAIVYKTINGGKSWIKMWSTNGDEQLSGIATKLYFLNQTTGWIWLNTSDNVGGNLYQTTDGGQNFHFVSNNSAHRPNAMDLLFTDESIGWVPCDPGAGPIDGGLMKTTDGGKTFKKIVTATSVDAVAFPTADIGYAIGWDYSQGGDAGFIMETIDGGKTWQRLSVSLSTSAH